MDCMTIQVPAGGKLLYLMLILMETAQQQKTKRLEQGQTWNGIIWNLRKLKNACKQTNSSQMPGSKISSLCYIWRCCKEKKKRAIWCDNCAVLNKNRTILIAIIYLIGKGVFESVELKFLISGHNFMGCDRDFGVIEKRRKVSKPVVPKELEEIVTSVRVPTFQYINTQNLRISKAFHINVTKKKPCVVKIANTFDFVEPSCTKTNVLKQCVSLDSLPAVEKLPWVNFTRDISKETRKHLLAMLAYLKVVYSQFYEDLLQVNSDNSMTEEHAENI
ncbi:hypothetical protein PR048_028177 [Dryococelus australis]|uniref:DUF7869 domain-containing protein n=1 Tax=Dryococelus australis TaxID=614101 RepID=A0ABQ9GII4_9NEOP|nr:hypothetical protein PR048_028177 [Dryococelus australis]